MAEIEDLLSLLDRQRGFLRHTADGLTEDQARDRTTISELTIGGIIKHVTQVEERWAAFVLGGAPAMEAAGSSASSAAWGAQFRMSADETLPGLLDAHAAATARTDDAARAADLDTAYELPERPWFPPGTSWTARHALLHLLAEISQHAGHADIIRESIDGAKTMG
jgi:uncharacterized damage-inducible protein DinB